MKAKELLNALKFKEIASILSFLREKGIYIPSSVPILLFLEDKKDIIIAHIYIQGFPTKVLITIDKEKEEVIIDWIELDRG